jgi:hypothetical protein
VEAMPETSRGEMRGTERPVSVWGCNITVFCWAHANGRTTAEFWAGGTHSRVEGMLNGRCHLSRFRKARNTGLIIDTRSLQTQDKQIRVKTFEGARIQRQALSHGLAPLGIAPP